MPGPSSQSRPIQRRERSNWSTDSSVERARSVSSIRNTNVPPVLRAKSQLKRAVLTPPTCNSPVGLGAYRTRISLFSMHVNYHANRALESSQSRGKGVMALPIRGISGRDNPVVGWFLSGGSCCENVAGPARGGGHPVDAVDGPLRGRDPARRPRRGLCVVRGPQVLPRPEPRPD